MLERWAAVVFDLDGTLVHLDVDWDDAAGEMADRLAMRGVALDGVDAWAALDAARSAELLDLVEPILADREVRAARRSERLPLADLLTAHPKPAAVCSLNCELACHAALETHGLTDHVDHVVGRDSVSTWKPDPHPLHAAIAGTDAPQDRSVFVGDSARDAETARRAGVEFRSVEEVLTEVTD